MAVLLLGIVQSALAQGTGIATSIDGLYYTGTDSSGNLLTNPGTPGNHSNTGVTDGNWTVTYARVNGSVYTGNSTYTGAAYVIADSYISDVSYVQNTSNAQWITAPGARTSTSTGPGSGSHTNAGGLYLPGNGTSGTNSAYFVYELTFTITGSGSPGDTVTNNIQVSMTIAADDNYTVYVNPVSSPTVNNSGTISAGGTSPVASRTSAWTNTDQFFFGNSDPTASRPDDVNNTTFKIGDNHIYIVVGNSNSATGNSSSTDLNASGLLVYQVEGDITFVSVPEPGTILYVIGALGFFLVWRFRRGRARALSGLGPGG